MTLRRLWITFVLAGLGCNNTASSTIPETVVWIDADPAVRNWVAGDQLRARIEHPDGTTTEWRRMSTTRFPQMAPVVAVGGDSERRFSLVVEASDSGHQVGSRVDTVFRRDGTIGQTLIKLTSNCQERHCLHTEVCVSGECVPSFVGENDLEDFDPNPDFGDWWSQGTPDGGTP